MFSLLIIIFFRYRFLLIKPSIIIITFFHLRIQWAATIQAGYIEKYLPQPSSFFILVHIFPLVGLIGAFFIFHKSSIEIFSRISRRSLNSLSFRKEIIYILLAIILFISIFYLGHIQFSQTGLYTIFVDPLKSAEARESSLKLIANPIVRYSYSFLKNVFAPLLVVFLMIFILQNIKKKFSRSLIATIMLIFTFLVVSLTGARSPAAALLLTIIWAFYLKNGMPIRPLYFILAILVVLTPTVILTILREGKVINLSLFLNYLGGGIFRRVFIIPMEVGLYHVHYAQMKGFFGIAAIPKIAVLLNIHPVNVANLIYISYTHFSHTIESGLANTSYVFSYYSYFGILSVILSLFGLWALDFSVLVFKKIKNNAILLACLGSIFVASMAFISTDYTIGLFTNGFLLLLLLTWMMDKINSYLDKTGARENLT